MRMKIISMFSLLILTVFGCYAPGTELHGNEPYLATLRTGEIFRVCKSGAVTCPVGSPQCDDLKVADVVDTPDGLGFKGISPGTTLCSVVSGGSHHVFRIMVH
jgi:hypothetical protein